MTDAILIHLPGRVLDREARRQAVADQRHTREQAKLIEYTRRVLTAALDDFDRELPTAILNVRHAAIVEVVKARLRGLVEMRLGEARL